MRYINGRVESLPLTNMRYINGWVESIVLHQQWWRIFLQRVDIHEETGFYIIKDSFFEDMDEPYVKGNIEGNRPHYYLLWGFSFRFVLDDSVIK